MYPPVVCVGGVGVCEVTSVDMLSERYICPLDAWEEIRLSFRCVKVCTVCSWCENALSLF